MYVKTIETPAYLKKPGLDLLTIGQMLSVCVSNVLKYTYPKGMIKNKSSVEVKFSRNIVVSLYPKKITIKSEWEKDLFNNNVIETFEDIFLNPNIFERETYKYMNL